MSRSLPHYDSAPDRPDAQEQAALDWLARLDRGLTPAQEAEFERWLAAHPQHGEAFGEFDGTWSVLNRLRETPEAAAAVAHGRIDPDAFAPRRGFPTWISRWSAPFLAAAALAVGVYLRWEGTPHAIPASDFTLTASSASASPRKLDLPDGSVVQLNRDSAVAVVFTAQERRVQLSRGEAHFTVAKHPARPFVVRASAVDVRAIGTAFNVRLQPEIVEVLVTEGKVRVNDERGRSLLPETPPAAESNSTSDQASGAATARALVAGEKVTIALVSHAIALPQPATPVAVPAADIGRALSWHTRQLEFASAPLVEVVAEFNRHNRLQIEIADANLATQRFGGTFRPDDVGGFVRLLETHFGIEAEQTPGKVTLRPVR